MKLEYIKLTNFALLRAGMGIDEIELDFRNSVHPLTLIIGNNGTGKTGLLSNLHPFATLGHLEARDDQDLIIPEEDGLKECIFSTKKHEYRIKHHYKWQPGRSRKISSYIKKDGEELNRPGTVSTFLDIVQREFDIDINFLKLIRLGGNVKNFVELSSAERIAFIGKLLTSVEKYLKVNKGMRERSSYLSSILKNNIQKRDGLGIEDVKMGELSIQTKEEKLAAYKKDLDKLTKEFYHFQGKYDLEKLKDAVDKTNEAKVAIRQLEERKASLKRPKKEYGASPDISVYAARIDEYNSALTDAKLALSGILTKISAIDKQIEEYEIYRNNALSEIQLKDMKQSVRDLMEKCEEYDSSLYDPSLEGLKSDVDRINIIYFHFDNLMRAGAAARIRLAERLVEYEGDMSKVEKEVKREHTELANELDSVKQPAAEKLFKKHCILLTAKGCPNPRKCSYYKAVKGVLDASHADLGEIETKFERVTTELDILPDVYAISRILSMREKNTYYDLDMMSVAKAIKLGNKAAIVDTRKVESAMDQLQLRKEYVENSTRLTELQSKLVAAESASNHNSREKYEELIAALRKESEGYEGERVKLQANTISLQAKLNEAKEDLADCNTFIEYQFQSNGIDLDISKYQSIIDRYSTIIQMKDIYQEEKDRYTKEAESLNFNIQMITDDINKARADLAQYKSLTEEIKSIQKQYDYVNDIKEATSQSDGIPLLHVKLYCRALCTIANDVIRRIYGGDFHLKKFDIDEGTFNIPYYTKGFTVKDIRDTSQAEASVAKLAISFAILSQFMTKYNIVLLDEVDGPMHQVNKEKFFSSIEGILSETLKCQQAFLITQSTLFNEFPVNFIVTDSEYKHMIPKDANVIFQR